MSEVPANPAVCSPSARGNVNSKWPRSSVIVAKRLSGENTSARLIGSCDTLFTTVPRRLSVCSMPAVLLCADNRATLLQQERAIPKASALRERGERIRFSVHSNFPEQTAMVGFLSHPNYGMFRTSLVSSRALAASFSSIKPDSATRRNGRTRHFHSSHHAITPGWSSTRKLSQRLTARPLNLTVTWPSSPLTGNGVRAKGKLIMFSGVQFCRSVSWGARKSVRGQRGAKSVPSEAPGRGNDSWERVKTPRRPKKAAVRH